MKYTRFDNLIDAVFYDGTETEVPRLGEAARELCENFGFPPLPTEKGGQAWAIHKGDGSLVLPGPAAPIMVRPETYVLIDTEFGFTLHTKDAFERTFTPVEGKSATNPNTLEDIANRVRVLEKKGAELSIFQEQCLSLIQDAEGDLCSLITYWAECLPEEMARRLGYRRGQVEPIILGFIYHHSEWIIQQRAEPGETFKKLDQQVEEFGKAVKELTKEEEE